MRKTVQPLALVAVCALLGLVEPATAQTATGEVNGTVQDASEASLPGATLVLRDIQTGVERTTISSESGTFSIPSVLPGLYTLTVSLPGFQTYVFGEFRLQVNEARTIPIQMQVGAVQQDITVRGEITPINKTDATMKTVIQSEEIVELPLNGRHFSQLTILSPGVSPVQTGQQNNFTISPGGFSPSVNGMRAQMNNFTLDGMDNNARFSNVFGSSPPADAIQEFNIQSHQTDAGASFAAGGNINVVTKSGTNALHGSAYEFHRNDALTANNFMDNYFGRDTVPFKQNQYGFTLGGPVTIPRVIDGRESKTYFFAYYEGFKRRTDASTSANVPDAAVRAGDFSQLLGDVVGTDGLGRPVRSGQIYDILTTEACAACSAGFIRDPFPNNVIPANRIHPVAQTYMDTFYPMPNREGFPNFVTSQSQAFDGWQFGTRIDQYLTDTRRLYGRYSQYDNADRTPGGLPEIPLSRFNHGLNTMAHWTEVLGPTSLFDIQFGYNRTGIPFQNKPQPESFANAVGPDLVFAVPGGYTPTTMSLRGSTYSSASWVNWELANPDDSFQFNFDFKKTFSRHDISYGYKLFHWRHVTVDQGSKNLSYVPTTTNQPGFVASGESLASFFVGLPQDSNNALFPFIKNYGWINVGYIQDRWKATQKLSLNLGLQYLYSTAPRLAGDRFSMMDYGLARSRPDATEFGFAYVWAADNPITGAGPNAQYSSIIAPDRNNFAPRVGLAYALNDKTVIRSGAGVFYDFNQNLVQNTQARKGATRWPYGEFTRLSGLNLIQVDPQINLDNPFPNPRPVAPSATATGDFFPRDPYAVHWNFGIQRNLPSNMIVTADYVGSLARKMPINMFFNLAPVGLGSIEDRRDLHNVGPLVFQDDNGSSNYNSFQFSLERRFSGGFTFRNAYTWAKALDYGTDANGISNGTPDLSIEYGPTDFDIKHNYRGSFVWEMPFGRGRRFGDNWGRVADAVLGGWQASGILTLRSGLVYNVVNGADTGNTGNPLAARLQRPNIVGDPELASPSREAWINTSAFALPALGSLGSMTRNSLRGPALQQFDFSVNKAFRFAEKAGVQLRVDLFNIFNHTNLGNPIENIRAATFGEILSANTARDVQLGVRFYW